MIVPEIHIQTLCNQFHCLMALHVKSHGFVIDKTQNFCVVETAENLYLTSGLRRPMAQDVYVKYAFLVIHTLL